MGPVGWVPLGWRTEEVGSLGTKWSKSPRIDGEIQEGMSTSAHANSRPVFFKGVETCPRKDVGWYLVVWKKILTHYFPFFQLFVLVD